MKTKITLVASLFAFTLVLQACSNEASPSAAPSETTNETVVANVESQDDQSETKSNEQEEGIRND